MSLACRENDENSRDSGFGDMDYDMPTDFAFPTSTQKASFQLKVLDMEMDDLVIQETMNIPGKDFACTESEEREAGRALSNLTSRPRALTDITNSPRFTVSESPKSRINTNGRGFALPLLRTQSSFGRKRALAEGLNEFKRHRAESIDEDQELVPSCSNISTMPSYSRSIHLHRVQSSSVLERGHYAHVEDELPKILEVKYHLNTISEHDSQAYRRIEASTLAGLLNSMSSQEFSSKYVLVDCRYPYEFNGGHIKNAINIYDPERCEELFYPGNPNHNGVIHKRIPIFYCEFSQKRGPSMAHALRRVDRQRNELRYPFVDFQEIYVLDKGYRNFYQLMSETTDKMMDSRFSTYLKRFTFHKKGFGGTTCSRAIEPRSRILLRQQSADDSQSPMSSNQRLTSRRPLFAEPRTPQSSLVGPLRPPQFS
uniref:M-phase inducer phosphatase n=1 Tax=Heterorhabditis bacteriophora TaxID=37862 RepID=A0A1I7XN76_HETBA